MARNPGRSGRVSVVGAEPAFEPLETRLMLSASTVASTLLDVAPDVTSTTVSGLTPAVVAHAYGFDSVYFSNGTVKGTGAGQTVAIVDAYDDPNIISDLKAFDAQFGISNNDNTGVFALTVAKMSSRIAADAGWALEIALDVEWAHAMAPGAHILLVEAASSGVTDLLAAVNYARNVSGVVAVSMSWGSSEFSSETAYDSYFLTPTNHVGGSGFKGGVTFVSASGDDGAPAEWPSVSPNVVAVGGTTLTVDSSGNYVSETGWSGSGGGVSKYESKPSYESSVTLSATKRTNPDVAYDADPSSGVAVYDSYAYNGKSGWFKVGGTSAAAPQWAALIAIADQGRALAGKGSLDGAGGTLPAIYSFSASDFHDITSGNNGYAALAGYDLVTGRGTPVVGRIVADFLTASSTIATPTPSPAPTPKPQPPGPPHGGRHWAEVAEPTASVTEVAVLAADSGSAVQAASASTGAAGANATRASGVTIVFAKHVEGHGGAADLFFAGADPFSGLKGQDILFA